MLDILHGKNWSCAEVINKALSFLCRKRGVLEGLESIAVWKPKNIGAVDYRC